MDVENEKNATSNARSTKVKPLWGLQNEKRVMEFYSDHQNLWDPKHSEYFNRVRRDALLTTLVQSLGVATNGVPFTVKDAKEKFKNLRTTYGREIKKIEDSKRSGTGTEDLYQSRWTHFQEMSFLKESMKAGPSKDSLEPQTSPTASNMDTVQSAVQTPPQKKKAARSTCSRQTLFDEAIRVLTSPEPKPTEGEDLFAQHIAASLKKFRPYVREQAKVEIQQVLLKYCSDIEED